MWKPALALSALTAQNARAARPSGSMDLVTGTAQSILKRCIDSLFLLAKNGSCHHSHAQLHTTNNRLKKKIKKKNHFINFA
jgi:hypothetical protein